MPILHLCVCRLKAPVPGKPRGSEVFLRYKGCPESEELCHSEPVLTSFAFPLGVEAVQAKEYMASEVCVLGQTAPPGAWSSTYTGCVVEHAHPEIH